MSPRYAPILFGFLLSGFMSFIVSGISSARALGVTAEALSAWLPSAWLFSWAVAFPAVLVAAPMVRRIVTRLTARAEPRG